MKELTVLAVLENLEAVLAFVSAELETGNCPVKTQMRIALALEEIYVNIARYAYPTANGHATVRCEVGGDPVQATIQFLDSGKPYNPLAREDPDVTLSAEQRDIGGLGIFMIKKIVDTVIYDYKDGNNILTIQKVWDTD